MWTIEGGLKIVRALQPATRQFGYHLALGGGVLNKGESKKDLDLYFLPMGGFGDTQEHKPDEMLRFLERLFGASTPICRNDPAYGNSEQLYAHAVHFTRMGGPRKDIKQRIDCFIF
jgi:hypothetical protein